VPVILLSGDDVTERCCGSLFPGARFVRVKTALGQRAARSLAPSVACARIRAGAAEAVRRCASVAPYRVAEPCRVEFELTSPTLADLCGIAPGAQRIDARTVGFDCATITEAIGWMSVCSSMSARLR
jgi:D-amino peptidase